MGLLDTETNDVDGVSCWSGDACSKICTCGAMFYF
jgi:hypothetical protein